jgi:hypothetical protein
LAAGGRGDRRRLRIAGIKSGRILLDKRVYRVCAGA